MLPLPRLRARVAHQLRKLAPVDRLGELEIEAGLLGLGPHSGTAVAGERYQVELVPSGGCADPAGD